MTDGNAGEILCIDVSLAVEGQADIESGTYKCGDWHVSHGILFMHEVIPPSGDEPIHLIMIPTSNIAGIMVSERSDRPRKTFMNR